MLEFQNWPDLYFTLNQILIHVPVLFQLGSILLIKSFSLQSAEAISMIFHARF